MSMITTLVPAADDEIQSLLADPETIEDFIEEKRTSLNLDKAWHGLHWLLTGSAEGGKEPLCYLVTGGEPIGDVDLGYGPARALTAEQVASWDAALAPISRDELAGRFDAKAMLDASIYPDIWARSASGEEDTLGYLLDAFGSLRDFVAEARQEHQGMVVYLS